MTASSAPFPWRDRATGMLLAAAAGDALGWPFERRDRTYRRNEASSRGGFFAWDRFTGSRPQRVPEHIRAGDYSDDTQMTIAVARARLTAGHQWLPWLERVEWPFLLDYERGAGASVKAACRSWTRGRAPWDGSVSGVSKYFATGANGAAMRIAPHVLVHHQDLKFDELAADVVRDAATTHGHPRALLGALVHAYALWVSLREPAPLPYGWLVDTLLDNAETWYQPVWRTLPENWQARAAGHFDSQFENLWMRTAAEVEELLAEAQKELKEGAVSAPTVFLTRQGLTSKDARGSGTLCAVAAAYLAARSASSPALGLTTAASLDGADTDTLASMTGGLLGAALGTEWLGVYARTIQDRALLVNLAEGLLEAPEEARVKLPTNEQAHRARSEFIEQASIVTSKCAVQLPDRRSAQLGPATDDQAAHRWLVAVTEDGQTLHLRRPEPPQPTLFASEAAPALVRGEPPRRHLRRQPPGTELQGAQLPVADLERVRDALVFFFDLHPDRTGSTWVSYGNVVLTQDRKPEVLPEAPRTELRITVTDPAAVVQLLTSHDLTVSGGDYTQAFRVQIDPLLTVVFTAAASGRTQRWDPGY
ncbi:ADP-ribosylglycohydrolase family protein [Streptomyces sp. NPDC002692]